MNNKLRNWLYRRADNPRQNLAILGVGFVVFFVGLLILGTAEFALQSSIAQEILGLAGLIILSTGIILAAIGYLSLSVLRIIRFISDDNHDK